MTYPKTQGTSTKEAGEKSHRLLFIFIILSVLFYGAMLVLTFTAQHIHTARLPQVTARRLSTQSFSYSYVNPSGYTMQSTTQRYALPKELVDSGKIFTVITSEKNGASYSYVWKINVTVLDGYTNKDYYAVDNTFFDAIVLTGYEALEDGMEVNVVK